MGMIRADIYEGRIDIESEFRQKDLVKRVPGTTFDRDRRTWTAPLAWSSCLALRGIFGAELEVGPALTEWAWHQRNHWIEPALNLRTQLEFPELLEQEPDLFPFQRAGVAFLYTVGRCAITDEMGSGKTIQLIRALNYLPDAFPALIVAPNTVKYNWRKEFERWFPQLKVVVVDGNITKRRQALAKVASGEAQVAVINWEGLRGHSRLEGYGSLRLKRCMACGGEDQSVKDTSCESHPKELNDIAWGTVIADEAHRAKDPKAKQTRALWAVGRQATYRFAATGTPVANHPGDLWSIMNFVSPDDFPRKTAFVDRYCLQSWNAFGGMEIVGVKPETRQEFGAIVDPRMIRRLKSVVLPQLPPKVYTTRLVEMTPKQRKAYNDMADLMITELDSGDVVYATNPLTKLTRLTQFASAYAELDAEGEVRLQDPSCKVDGLLEILEEAAGEQVVVFAESRQLIELASQRLTKEKVTHGLITGAVPPLERQNNVDAFQAGKLRVMLCTMGAGGEGITLTAARIVVFLQRSWSLVKNKQAEDRVHRPGQDANKVEIIDVVSMGTVDSEIIDVRELKEERLQEVVRDKDTVRRMLERRAA